VNMTEADPEAGTGKAVYDMPWDDNGQRTAQRSASPLQVLLQEDGDVLYAGFRIQPARAQGVMLFRLDLVQVAGGGQPDLSFGMNGGDFVVGNGGVNTDLTGGEPDTEEMQVVLRVEYGDGGGGPDDFEVVTLWVDPVDESSVPVIDSAQIDFLNPGGARLTGIAIRGDQMAGQPAFFDDLAIGHAFLDVVEAPPSDALTNHAGMNGLFYDPDNPGHGFSFAAHYLGFTVHYYGHTNSGERLWLISENHLGDLGFGEPFELQMYEVLSGLFGRPQLPIDHWGTLTLELDDCDSGHAMFDGQQGVLEMDFVRLSAVPGIACQ
ncbi:MAG: hypothetical protein KJO72_12970, partial [Gammaproteobacteria bacterium]|nr:hypothetical protein [Gammaproteobacteria bacterium]